MSFCQRVLLAAFEGLVDIEEVRPVRHELHGLVELFALQAGIVGGVPVGAVNHVAHAVMRLGHIRVMHDGLGLAEHHGVDEFPHHFAVGSDFKEVAGLSGSHEPVAVGQKLGCALTVAEERGGIFGFVAPHDLVSFRIHLDDAGSVDLRAFGAVVEDLDVAVFERLGVMFAEHDLGTVVIPAGFDSLAVRGGVAPALHDLAGFVINDEDFAEVAGVDQDLIGLGDVGDGVEMREVKVRVAGADRFGEAVVGIELILSGSEMIPHVPFPNSFALGIHFADEVDPEVRQPDAVDNNVIAPGAGLASLGDEFFGSLGFPCEDQGIAVGHTAEAVVLYFPGAAQLVRPDNLAVPVDFLEQAAGAADMHGPVRQGAGAQEVAVGEKLGIEAWRVLALPGMDDVTIHVDEIGGRGFHRGSEERVAFEGLVSFVLGDASRAVVKFYGLSGLGAEKEGAGHEACSEEPVHKLLLCRQKAGKTA